LKAQVHAVLAKEGVAVGMSDLFGRDGMNLLAEARLGTCYRMRVDSLLELIDAFDAEVAWLSDAIAARLRHHPGYHAIQAIPGVGPTFAAVFTVEIGDIGRFTRPAQLCSWAGAEDRADGTCPRPTTVQWQPAQPYECHRTGLSPAVPHNQRILHPRGCRTECIGATSNCSIQLLPTSKESLTCAFG
jgi:hypothetical protein